MKILLWIFFAAYATHLSHADPTLRILEIAVEANKKQVMRVIEDLTELEKNYEFNLSNKLNVKNYRVRQRVDGMLNSTLNEVQIIFQQSKKNSSDLLSCYNSVKQRLHSYKEIVPSQLDVCVRNAVTYVNPIVDKIITLTKTARKIYSDLKSIFPKCASKIIIVTQNCVWRKIRLNKLPIRNLERNLENLKNNARTSSNVAVGTGKICMEKLAKHIHQRAIGDTERIKSCISRFP